MTQKQCYTYLRVSTEMQEEGYSLAAQRERLAREAQYRDMAIAREFADEGFSGKSIAGRPTFQEMLGLIRNGNPDHVVYVQVLKLSRIGRNTEDVLASLRIMQSCGVNLIACEEGIDSAGPVGKLMISVIAAEAEIERVNIRAQTYAGRMQKAREGRWNGGRAPFGYRIDRDSGILLVNEKEATIVRLIFDRYVNHGFGLRRIANWLNAVGYRRTLRTKASTMNLFTDRFVKKIMDNPVYAGYIAYGRRQNVQREGGSLAQKYMNDVPMFEVQHQPIISKELWEEARKLREISRACCAEPIDPEKVHILSGILRCPVCSGCMSGSVTHRKGMAFRYYACNNCKRVSGIQYTFRKTPRQEGVNREVIAAVAAAVKSPTFAGAMQEVMNTHTNEDTVTRRLESLEQTRRQHIAAKNKLAQQLDSMDPASLMYDIMYDDMNSRLQKIYSQLLVIDKDIAEARRDLDRLNGNRATMDQAYGLLTATSEKLPEMTDAEQREMINAFIDKVQIYPVKRSDGTCVKSIHFRFPVMLEPGVETDCLCMDSLGNAIDD